MKVFLPIVLLISGCTVVSDYSQNSEFAAATAAKSPLLRDIMLCPSLGTSSSDRELPTLQMFDMPRRVCPGHGLGKVVQAGEMVSVSEIRSITTYGVKIFNQVYAVGTVSSSTGEGMAFFYDLGSVGCVYRAPWQEQLGSCDRRVAH